MPDTPKPDDDDEDFLRKLREVSRPGFSPKIDMESMFGRLRAAMDREGETAPTTESSAEEAVRSAREEFEKQERALNNNAIEKTVEHGNVKIGIFETQGKRPSQEDVFFTAGIDAIPSAVAPKLLGYAFDEAVNRNAGHQREGATALVGILSKDRKVTLANLGDCGSVLFVLHPDGAVNAHPLLKPHSLNSRNERRRVENNGGEVYWDRGIRRLASYRALSKAGEKDEDRLGIIPSRVIGDAAFPAIRTPSIKQFDLNSYITDPRDQLFLCLSCDGFYERGMTPQTYASLLENKLADGVPIKDIPRVMAAYAIEHRSSDNLTVLFTPIPKEISQDVVMGVIDGHGGKRVALLAEEILRRDLTDASWRQQVLGKKGSSPDSPAR